MKVPQNIAGWLGLVTAFAGVCGILYTTIDQIATKDYHEEDLKPMLKSLENIEASAVVQRIRGLHRSRCGGNFPPSLQNLLDQQVIRYKELTGREFRPGECRDGVWYTASGVPG